MQQPHMQCIATRSSGVMAWFASTVVRSSELDTHASVFAAALLTNIAEAGMKACPCHNKR